MDQAKGYEEVDKAILDKINQEGANTMFDFGIVVVHELPHARAGRIQRVFFSNSTCVEFTPWFPCGHFLGVRED